MGAVSAHSLLCLLVCLRAFQWNQAALQRHRHRLGAALHIQLVENM